MSRLEKAEIAFAKLFQGSFGRTFTCFRKSAWKQTGDIWVRRFEVTCRNKNQNLIKLFTIQFHPKQVEIAETSLSDEILVF